MNQTITVLALLLSSVALGQTQGAETQTTFQAQIDGYIEVLMNRHGIPGVALAVIQDGKALHQKNYGYANLEHQVPITNQSIFRVYSLTKPIVVVGVFQLIEEGKLSLESEVSEYVPDLPQAWQSIKIKHLLAHTSGLPDMSPIPEFQDLTEEEALEKVLAQECKFKPGQRYDYNQTGFWLLKKVIERIEDADLASWISQRQFPSPCDTAFFSSDSRDVVLHRTTPYFPFTKGTLTIDHPYLQGTYAHAMNGLNITLSEFIKWDQALHNNSWMEPATRDQMWEECDYTQSDKVFTYGWDKRLVGNHVSYGFSGSLITAYRIFPADNISILFLSNGLTKFYNIENVMNDLAAMALEYIEIGGE
ncbi:MAG: serine hydrolase domain-containing protein [Bacteroidota bacterium]